MDALKKSTREMAKNKTQRIRVEKKRRKKNEIKELKAHENIRALASIKLVELKDSK